MNILHIVDSDMETMKINMHLVDPDESNDIYYITIPMNILSIDVIMICKK